MLKCLLAAYFIAPKILKIFHTFETSNDFIGFSTFMVKSELAVGRQKYICVTISVTFGLALE